MKNRETDEWLKQNLRSTRNFIRKWGSMVNHNEYLKPIVPPKYDIGLLINNCSYEMLQALEPYCNQIYLEHDSFFEDYLKEEGPNSGYDLSPKLLTRDVKPFNDVLIEFDGNEMTQESYNIFLQFPNILEESGEPDSNFILDIFKVKTKLLDNQVDLLVNSVQK